MRPLFFLWLFPNGLNLPRYMKVRERFAGKDLGSGSVLMQALSNDLSRAINRSASEARRWIESAFYPTFVRMMSFMWSPGQDITGTVGSLSRQGIQCAVLSDYAMVPQRLAGLGIDPAVFELTASSETEGALKPHPRPFLGIAEKMAVDPRNVLVVGDRVDTDGEAAAAAGMPFLQIAHRPPPHSMVAGWPEIRGRLLDLR
jgi:FMN phosphatase YigB (HAD superfamily)